MILFEGPTRSPRSSSSRCRTPAAASRRRPDTSSGCARSATSTTCCWSPTRSSAASAASATTSPPTTYGYQPDIITCAKGMTSGYSPIGAMIVSDRIYEPFNARARPRSCTATRSAGTRSRPRSRWPTSTSSSEENLNENVRQERGPAFRATLEKLNDLPIVGDVRGDGYFYGIELVKDKATKETFDDDESERLLRGFLSNALFDAGLVLPRRRPRRPGVQLAPPLIMRPGRVRRDRGHPARVLTEAWSRPPQCSNSPSTSAR
jgi:adenosylmethionine-8-amino-7-oxononanoate aminotransferase